MLDVGEQQFLVLYRQFLFHVVDLELMSASGDVSKLLGQFGALLAAFSFLLAGSARGYAQSTAPPSEVLISAWGAEQFLISTTTLAVGIFAVDG